MHKAEQQIRELMTAFEQDRPLTPVLPDYDVRELRQNMLEEEYQEYVEAENDHDIVEVADALADMMVIIIGTAIAYGIPIAKVWDEVHRSNMAKVDSDTGTVKKRHDGKVLKPDTWTPPNITGVLMSAGYQPIKSILKAIDDTTKVYIATCLDGVYAPISKPDAVQCVMDWQQWGKLENVPVRVVEGIAYIG